MCGNTVRRMDRQSSAAEGRLASGRATSMEVVMPSTAAAAAAVVRVREAHVSAVCKLIPRPPARVVIRKRKILEAGALKDCRLTIRCTRLVEPVRRTKDQSRSRQ